MDRARILLVDDMPINLRILSELLAPDYQVILSTKGMDGVRLASTPPYPDLVLLDIEMPDLDGYRVCEILKSQDTTKHIPIIFITAKANIEEEEKGLSLGAVDYITKPFSPSIVLARIKAQLSLYSQQQLLEGLVQKRTAELEKTRQEAEAANVAKSAFLSNISHELRTPLNGMMGMTQLLMRTEISAEQREFLEDAYNSSVRLLDMVNDLLTLSTAEAGRVEVCLIDFKPLEDLKGLLTFYRRLAENKGLWFNVAYGSPIPSCMNTDITRTRRVLANLLDNALRFTEEGGIDVCIDVIGEAKPKVGDDVQLMVSVSDTGVGVPENIKEIIFEPFVIGEDFMTKEHGGAGLGLCIAKRLVNIMGGDIWLERSSEPDTVFRFTVPCKVS